MGAALGAPAQAETSATITPSISPDKLRSKAALTLTIHYTTATPGLFGVPAPVLRTVVRLPAGLNLDIPDLRSCSASRLRAHGPNGCPAQSRIGHGHALIETHAGTENIPEGIALSAFLGPLQGGQQTLDILGQGYTPLDERFVLTGAVLFVAAPYGEELEMSVPPIPTLRFEPDASLVNFTLTSAHTDGQRAVRTRCSCLPPAPRAASRSPPNSPTPTAPPEVRSPPRPARSGSGSGGGRQGPSSVCTPRPEDRSWGLPRFFRNVRGSSLRGVAIAQGKSYFESRRGTEPQRARPPRCEAAPPTEEGLRAGPSWFLKRPGTASISFSAISFSAATLDRQRTSLGTTGFDAVGSWGWWRVEVPGGLVKHPGKP